MNKYQIRVNNAVIESSAIGEYAALKNLCIFGQIEMLEAVKVTDAPNDRPELSWGWIYKVDTVNGIALAYIKRIA